MTLMTCSWGAPNGESRGSRHSPPGLTRGCAYGQYAGCTVLDDTEPVPLDGPADKVMKALPKYQWLRLHAIPDSVASGT